jgi:hypothetical protein
MAVQAECILAVIDDHERAEPGKRGGIGDDAGMNGAHRRAFRRGNLDAIADDSAAEAVGRAPSEMRQQRAAHGRRERAAKRFDRQRRSRSSTTSRQSTLQLLLRALQIADKARGDVPPAVELVEATVVAATAASSACRARAAPPRAASTSARR